MSEYVQNFKKQTDGVLGYLQNQLTQFGLWQSVPGVLTKTAAAGGYVWGMNASGTIYMCREPCAGNWVKIDTPTTVSRGCDIPVSERIAAPMEISWDATLSVEDNRNRQRKVCKDCWDETTKGSPLCYKQIPADLNVKVLDIAADNKNVYIVFDANQIRKLARRPLDGSGEWSVQDGVKGAYDSGNTIHATDSYLFMGGKRCAKPCTTGNWVDFKGPTASNSGVVATGSDSIYTIDTSNGKVLKTNEAGQGGWTEVPALSGKTPVSASIDSVAIYAATKSGKYERCEYPYDSTDDCKKIDTQGYIPSSLSVNPSNNRVWMTTTESNSKGNIFQRLDRENPDTVLDEVTQFDKQRERDVNSLGDTLKFQGAEISAALTRREAAEVIKDATKINENIQDIANESEMLRTKIRTHKEQSSGYTQKMNILKILAFTLAVVLLIYLTAGLVLPASITSAIALFALSAGLGTAIYFSVHK